MSEQTLANKLWQQGIEFEDFCCSVGYAEHDLRKEFIVYMHPGTIVDLSKETGQVPLPLFILGYDLVAVSAAKKGCLTFMPKHISWGLE